MENHKEILKQEFNIDANTKHHNYLYLHKAILKAMNLAAKQAFKAGRSDVENEDCNIIIDDPDSYFTLEYVTFEDYLNEINNEKD